MTISFFVVPLVGLMISRKIQMCISEGQKQYFLYSYRSDRGHREANGEGGPPPSRVGASEDFTEEVTWELS